AGKDHGPAGRRLETLRPIFRETHLATVEIGIEIDGNCEAAVRRALRGVGAMRTEVSGILGCVARHDVTLHARYLELVDLEDFRGDPPLNARLRLADQVGIFDRVVPAAFMRGVLNLDRLSSDIAHEAGLL